jgi:uncharacterized protein (DUF433 family)
MVAKRRLGRMTNHRYSLLEVPNYSIPEAAQYLHVSPNTLWYWVIGERGTAPLTTIYSRRPLLLSFKNLVECFVLESLKCVHGMSIKSIRTSVEELRRERQSKYPLADHQLFTRRGKLYLEGDGNELVTLRPGGQRAFKDILQPFLKRVERNTYGISERLFPFTRPEYLRAPEKAPSVVVIDPLVAFGKPVLVNSRISTAFLMTRRRSGASIVQLAKDYGRSETEIEEAIFLEQAKAA